jgi:hypothetical protein
VDGGSESHATNVRTINAPPIRDAISTDTQKAWPAMAGQWRVNRVRCKRWDRPRA